MNRPIRIALIPVAILGFTACDGERRTSSSDQRQSAEQERILQEGTSQVGMPAITNFFERKQLKAIYELRDQAGLSTYTYLVSEMNAELKFFCNSIGYGIPYATQFTNPEKINTDWNQRGFGMVALPQADPNGLFSPASADGTWVLCKDPNGPEVKPVFIEPRIVVSPFPMDRGGRAEAPAPKTP
jgi:hypothetical protein